MVTEAEAFEDWIELVLSCPYDDVHEPDDWYRALALLMAERAPA